MATVDRSSKPSFTKSLFLGRLDSELVMPYPVMAADERERVHTLASKAREYLVSVYDPMKAERDGWVGDDTIRDLGELGLLGLFVDREYGGQGLSQTGYCRVMEEFGRVDGTLAVVMGVHQSIGTKPIYLFGTDEQKARLLPDLASGRKLAAFALTEPNVGSDAYNLETWAERQSDGSWLLTGEKRWIGNGTIADVTVVWARDVDDKQVKGFLVEKGAEGYQAERMLGKASLRAVWQARITLTDVRVAEAMRLPGGNSFRDTGRVLAGTRYAVAWGALGHATAAYDIAVAYCMERQQFGKPLVRFQLVQDKLVKMLAEICSMQLYCLRLARLQEEGTITDTIAALAKMNNTRKARQVILEARDLLGGNGILLDHHVMRHMADIEAIHTYEGTETIQTLIVGRDITGVSAFT